MNIGDYFYFYGTHVRPQQLQAENTTTYLDHVCALEISSRAANHRLTGIICTFGPSSRDVDILENLIEAGMTIVRINLTHGSHIYHTESIANIRTAAANYSAKIGRTYPLPIAFDIKGPKIRIGILEGGVAAEFELIKGDTIKLTTDKAFAEKGNAQIIYVDYENIMKVVQPGGHVFVDEGRICLIVESIQGTNINCTVETGGLIGSRKGVNLPGASIDLPAISEKDKLDIQFAVEQEVDMIFASFVRDAKTLTQIRDVLGEAGKKILVVSKIENQQGIKNIDAIIEASDGVMVARGDLGIELPAEKLFLAQKIIIARCNKLGKPVICATQMLHSMIKKPRPTRAETSDVAHAVLEGSDCVMLTGETARGEYPLKSVLMMSNICKEAEAAIWYRQLLDELKSNALPPIDIAHATAIAAVEASSKTLAAAIVVITTSGRSAHLISQYRPRCPIIAVTRNSQAARQCYLHRAILPLIYEAERLPDWIQDVDARVKYGITRGKIEEMLKTGDAVIVVTEWKQGSGFTNTIRVVYVTDSLESIVY